MITSFLNILIIGVILCTISQCNLLYTNSKKTNKRIILLLVIIKFNKHVNHDFYIKFDYKLS